MADTAGLFDIPAGIYAQSHSVGCLPHSAREALEASLLRPWASKGGGAWGDWLGAVEGFSSALAGLLNTQASHICPQPCVSDAFYNILTALPEARGKRLLMHGEAFPSLGFVVHGLAPQGFSLMLEDGPAEALETWDRALTSEVDVALITHAHSNTGKLSPVADIARVCRERGILCLIDVAQSAGVIPIDLEAWGADAIVGSCVKWLCGGPGAGWLWVSEALLPDLSPQRLGWVSHEDPFEFDIKDFRAAPSALKFWGGTPSVAPYVLARAGIEAIASIGVEAVRAHNLALMRACLDTAGLDSHLLDPEVNTGTLCLTFAEDRVPDARAALDAIQCHHDWRARTARLSFHAFNTAGEAGTVGRAIAPFLSHR